MAESAVDMEVSQRETTNLDLGVFEFCGSVAFAREDPIVSLYYSLSHSGQ